MATPSAPLLYPELEKEAPTLPKTPPNAAQGYRLDLICRLQISKALDDEKITDIEFQMIKGELEKYYILKDEIRSVHRKTAAISSSEKKKLIQLGRDKARESFMKKIQGGS